MDVNGISTEDKNGLEILHSFGFTILENILDVNGMKREHKDDQESSHRFV